MHNLHKISAAIALVALSLVVGVVSVKAAPTEIGTLATATTLTPVLSTVIGVANNIGNDNFATTDLTTQVDPSTTSTQHYGPYASNSTDSGTCGNDWANDTFNRHFTVFQNRADGSLLVVEQFKDGTFMTPASDSPSVNFSPGACQTSPVPSGIVNDGIIGRLHGYFIISNVGAQTSQSSYCDATAMSNANCDTTTFINTHFAACYPVTCTVTTFFFHYAAGDQGLIYNEWKNASADRGGNSGDIRSANI